MKSSSFTLEAEGWGVGTEALILSMLMTKESETAWLRFVTPAQRPMGSHITVAVWKTGR